MCSDQRPKAPYLSWWRAGIDIPSLTSITSTEIRRVRIHRTEGQLGIGVNRPNPECSGAVVSDVRPNCSANDELHPGDMILSVNGDTNVWAYLHSQECRSVDELDLVVELRSSVPGGAASMIDREPSMQDSLCSELSDMSLDDLRSPPASLHVPQFPPVNPALQALALKSPDRVHWQERVIRYPKANLVRIKELKKKIPTGTLSDINKFWVLIKSVDNFGPAQEPHLLNGDWLISIDNHRIDLKTPSNEIMAMVTQAGESAITFVVGRAVAEGDIAQPQPGVFSMSSIPRQPPTTVRPLISRPQPGVYQSRHYAPVSTSVTMPHTSFLGELAQSSEVMLSNLEKLGHYRIVIHDSANVGIENIKASLLDLFGIQTLQSLVEWGCLAQFHLHVSFKRSSSEVDLQSVNCEREESCDFELHESFDQLVRRNSTGRSSSILSQHASFRQLERQVSTYDHQLHVDVIIPQKSEPTMWFSPVIYCKHSINVIYIDRNTDWLVICNLLKEIRAYSTDYSNNYDDGKYKSKVLLVIREGCPVAQVKDKILHDLKAYMSMLIINPSDHEPFLLVTASDRMEAKRILIKELRHHSRKDTKSHRYPHLAVILWQLLRKKCGILEWRGVKELVEQTLRGQPSDDGMEDLSEVTNRVLRYVHNSGLGYVPEYGYPRVIGKGCRELSHSIAVHPHRLIQAANPMIMMPRLGIDRGAFEHFRRHGEATVLFLQQLVESSYSERLVALLKDIHVALPIPRHRDGYELLVPFITPDFYSAEEHDLLVKQCEVDLVLKYAVAPPLLLLARFLSELRKVADSCEVQYNRCSGTFYLFNQCVLVDMAHRSAALQRLPVSLSQTGNCIGFYLKGNVMDVPMFTSKLVKFIEDFHSSSGLTVEFGPLCPLSARCSQQTGELHVLNMLHPSCSMYTCCGHNVSEAVKTYTECGRLETERMLPRRPTRELLLEAKPAIMPEHVLAELNSVAICYALAAQLGLDDDTVSTLIGDGDHPAVSTQRIIKSAGENLTIKQLISVLVDCNEMDTVQRITDWLFAMP